MPAGAQKQAEPVLDLDLTGVPDDMTVEEYLQKQCRKQVDRIHARAHELVQAFLQEAEKVKEEFKNTVNQEARWCAGWLIKVPTWGMLVAPCSQSRSA
eukprot:tig00000383_g24727.t1